MANKVDVRIVKSKEALMTSLVKLLSDKNLDELNISEICEEASVNRNTFYSHYSSVRDLFDEMKGKYIESFISSFKGSADDKEAFSKAIVDVMEKMRSMGPITKVIIGQTNPFLFLKTLLLLCIPEFNNLRSKSDDISSEDLFILLLGGIENLILSWVEKDFPESPKTLGKKIISFISIFAEM